MKQEVQINSDWVMVLILIALLSQCEAQGQIAKQLKRMADGQSSQVEKPKAGP